MENTQQPEPETKGTVLDKLPASFQKYLTDCGVDISVFYDAQYIENLPRYIRVNPLKSTSIEEIQSDLNNQMTPVNWIPNVYSLPPTMKISYTQAYKNGEIYGIDLSSCAVVLALDPKPNENILDLCCSPGTKLCYIADLMKTQSDNIEGSLTGNDINQHRLNICKTLVDKYGHSGLIKLHCEDGTTFKKLAKENELYDKILVDAECTHDGSIKHLFKYCQGGDNKCEKNVEREEEEVKEEVKEEKKEEVKEEEKKLSNKEKKRRAKQRAQHLENLERKKMKINNEWTFESFEDRVMNEEKLNNITSLQKNLVVNAFSLLKPQGILVYSTCSFIKAQNEDVVKFLLEECPETKGRLEVIDVFDPSIRPNIPCREGFLEKTIRFDPKTSNTGGMFISKLRKLS